TEGPWLAVELVRGVSLQRLMKTVFETGEKFTERLVVYIGRCICDGLAEAHNLRSAEGGLLNLVHRDLTPGNILLGFAGEVKITDFGLAKAKQRLTKTLTGLLKGQPQYMSPEQVNGANLDGRSDLFALGVVLFELFSGRRPWKATTDLDAMRAITDEEPESLQSLRPAIDKALVKVVQSCLEKKPAERCESALTLRDRLNEWLVAHGYKDDNDKVLARFVRRNAMRQMRWFERAVAGEFAQKIAAGRGVPLHGNKHSVPAPSSFPPPPPKAPTGVTSPTRKGTLATSPTVAEAPNSRKRGQRPAQPGPDKGKAARVGGAASEPQKPSGGLDGAKAGADPDNIDWGDDGPTLIQKSDAARKALEEADLKAELALPAGEQTTRRQRAHKGVVPGRAPVGSPAPGGATPGGDADARATAPSISEETTTDESKPASQASAALANGAGGARQRTGDTTTKSFKAPGVVAPHDPHVPPVPPGTNAPPTVAAAVPGGTAGPGPEPPGISPDGTATAVAIKPESLIADPVSDGDAPTIEAQVPLPPTGAVPAVVDQKLAPLPAPRFPSLPSVDERTADYNAEARRLGEGAQQAAEAAERAAALAEVAARAASLAGQASLLAAAGDQQGASKRLLEAQLVDEALRRGEIPARPSVPPGGFGADDTRQNWLGRTTSVLSSREGVTLIVIVTIGLMLVVLLVAIVW
ncbi:MAG: protein kinase, partial [Deltaproteobacteria bacterium]|nr:protein kinase [Deltaproteobacteria bacterium]